MTKPLNQSKRLKQLEATVQEQEATILHLRTENSVLLAKLALKRRRKPVTQSPHTKLAEAVITTNRARLQARQKRATVLDEHGVHVSAPKFRRPARSASSILRGMIRG